MSHTSIIEKWPSLTEFANDLSVRYGTAKAMRRRGSIPAPYWPAMVKRAAERGLEGVTLDELAAAVERERAA